MKNYSFLTLLLILILASCSKEDTDLLGLPSDGLINLSELKVGQRSLYLKYETTCTAQPEDFKYTGDTIVLEVVEENGQLSFKESYTVHSPLYVAGQESKIYPVEKQNERILLRDRSFSALFFFYANDTLHLEPVHTTTISQSGCMLVQNGDPFIGNDIAWMSRFKIGDILQKAKTVVSCEPLEQLDAYLIYDKYQLYQSHVSYFDLLNSDLITGWVLVE